uniref:Transposase n=1 Tax=Heterorhabditis bacteriophora TaxID=37862 RepID=A0A1I7XJN3_HETBA
MANDGKDEIVHYASDKPKYECPCRKAMDKSRHEGLMYSLRWGIEMGMVHAVRKLNKDKNALC